MTAPEDRSWLRIDAAPTSASGRLETKIAAKRARPAGTLAQRDAQGPVFRHTVECHRGQQGHSGGTTGGHLARRFFGGGGIGVELRASPKLVSGRRMGPGLRPPVQKRAQDREYQSTPQQTGCGPHNAATFVSVLERLER
ncbi:MAG TPA: hypothetical protein VF885_06675 [Arthrobacter sp.]